MPMNSPGTILKLWNKTVTKLDDGKKPADLPKKGIEQKLKIKNGLTALKFEAPAAKANPGPFIIKRDKSALLLRKFCRYLKTAKDEDKKVTQKFLKKVMALAVMVAKLDPGSIDLSEEEGSLEALDAEDTSALASALEKPDTEPDVGDAPMPQEVVAGASAVPTTPAKTQPAKPTQAKEEPKPEPAAAWAARRQALEPQLLAALKGQHPNASQLRSVFAFASEKAEAGDYTKALQGLDSLAKLLSAGIGANTDATPSAAATLEKWQAACTEVKTQMRKVQGEIAKAKDVNSAKAVMRLESVIKNLARPPASHQDVLELERWVRDDDVITRVETPNPWGFPVQVRNRLLPVLEVLKTQLPA